MDSPSRSIAPAQQAPLGFAEFVTLAAALMALTALGIDSMLPALPAIGESLGVDSANHRQFVITAFLIGFGTAQLIYGPLSDRYGRRPVLLIALGFYVVTSGIAALSGSFALLLVSRVAMGTAAAGSRVVTVALVRDCYAGRAMARVMSLVFIVFMAAPIFAPAVGQAILSAGGSWRTIFWGCGAIGAAVFLWFALRMPETLGRENRQSLHPMRVIADYGTMLRDRAAVGYTIATALLSGALFGFIGSVQQIMSDVFHRPELLTPVFATVAGTMAVGSFLNSRIVMRLGTRVISHTALVGLTLVAGVHLLVTLLALETLWSFAILQALMMACFGLATSNFSAMAMEKMGAIAGTASSLQGFVTTLAGALIGAAIGQAFDGTTVPLYSGFLLMGGLSIVVVAITERGRMFRPS
ncbi:multidrug effflux MFS transporter [Sphingomonas sp. HT-1]|uniref:multidrug effflux MFS transporter n=1 Tax=unclassified Sphingomonas TaxID=196159 RepID=UPI0002EAE52E|nr:MULTISPECIES: Bcr/CflA family efflux MFS transporter [unclassified Sphingomonas]KTF67984.1 MFS transporter [Sphingomonas sp. WG]